MQNRVRVRRDRPSALSWAVALAVTMLAVWLVTLSVPGAQPAEDAAADLRVTREVDFSGLTMWFADLGAYPDEWQARVAAAGYTGRGAAGVVYACEGEYHVLGAGYGLESDAERIARRLSEDEGMAADALSLSADAVSLRITAPEADAEAIVDADLLIRQQLSQTNTLALQVDRGEISFSSARTLARVAASEVRSARKRLSQIPGGTDQPVCAQLIEQLQSLENNLSDAAAGNLTGAELSGKLRCAHVDGALKLIQFLNGLSG